LNNLRSSLKKRRVIFSLYIPHDADITHTARKLHFESGTAENIKDVHHRQKVKRALKFLLTEVNWYKSKKKQKKWLGFFCHR